MSNKRYPDEFKREVVYQVRPQRGQGSDGAGCHHLQSVCLDQEVCPDLAEHAATAEQGEIKRLNKELKRVTEERVILKNCGVLRQSAEVKHVFIKEQSRHFPVRRLWLYVEANELQGLDGTRGAGLNQNFRSIII